MGLFIQVLAGGLYDQCFQLAVPANSRSAVHARFASKKKKVKQVFFCLFCFVIFELRCSVLDIDSS